MHWRNLTFDWNQTRAFLVTAEEGTLSAAARALGMTQPTLGRQVASLEAALGVTLFERVGRSLALTESGLELLEHARIMGEAANRMSLAASGRSQAIEGEVRITATHVMSAFFLPEAIKRLQTLAPGITIDVVASNTVRDLQRREADIAIRHVRPEQPDLIAKLVRETTAHFYASKIYLAEHGHPKTVDDLAAATFIGFDDVERFIPYLNERGIPLTKDNFRMSSDSGVVCWEMVKQGLGIGINTRELAETTPDVEQVLPDLEPFPVPIWLTTHRELHTSRRIRLVFDFLAEELSDKADA